MHKRSKKRCYKPKKIYKNNEIINEIKFLDKNKNFDSALQLIDSYLCEYPNDDYMKVYKCLIICKNGNFEEAEKILLDYLQNENFSKKNIVFAKSILGNIAYIKKDNNKAIDYYLDVVNESDFPEIFTRGKLSHIFALDKRYNDALKILEIKGYNDENLNIKRGFVYILKHEYISALNELERPIENKYNYPTEKVDENFLKQDKNYIYGHIFYKMGNFNKALIYLNNALTLRMRKIYYEAYLDIIDINNKMGNYNDAIAMCKEIKKSATTETLKRRINNALAESYIRKKDFVEGIKICEKGGLSDLFTEGKLYLNKGEFEKAEKKLEVFKTVVLNDFSFYDAFYNLILVKFRLKKYDEVFELLDLFNNFDNTKPIESIKKHLHRVKAIIYMELGYKLEEKNNTYTEKQILNYSKKNAINHIINHHIKKNTYSKFRDGINIEELIEEVKKDLVEKNISYGSIFDEYVIPYPNIGSDLNGFSINNLKVVTITNTSNILTMYPFDADLYEDEIEIEEKPVKVKKLSQIDKFKMRYGNNY